MRRSTMAAVVVSLLLHALALLWFWPELTRELTSPPAPGHITARLTPRTEPKPAEPVPAPEPPVAAAPEPRPRPQKPEPRRRSAPPVIARRAPSPERPVAPPLQKPLPEPFPQPPQRDVSPDTDMMANMRQRQAQREAQVDKYRNERPGNDLPNPDELAMARIKKNLEIRPDKNGIFTVRDLGVRTAVVVFRGWRGNDRRSAIGEEFPVDAGVNGNVETAVIEKVIWVIRRDYQGDFDWESYRLGRVVKLSAREKDTPRLVAFLRQELFTNY